VTLLNTTQVLNKDTSKIDSCITAKPTNRYRPPGLFYATGSHQANTKCRHTQRLSM